MYRLTVLEVAQFFSQPILIKHRFNYNLSLTNVRITYRHNSTNNMRSQACLSTAYRRVCVCVYMHVYDAVFTRVFNEIISGVCVCVYVSV